MLGVEFFPLIGPRCQLVDLANLPGQAFTLTLQAVLCICSLSQSFVCAPPVLPGLCQSCCAKTCISIKQAADRIGARQTLPGVLSVNVHQQIGNLTQLCGGGGAAIDPGPAFPLSVNGPAQQQLVVGRKACFFQPARELDRRIKRDADFATHRTFTHHPGISA